MNGKPVSEEQLQAWADEAEQGYSVEQLSPSPRRRAGRDGRGADG